MKHFYLFLVALTITGHLQAQQRPHFSQYMINNYILNPAISGIEDYTDLKFGFRRQWMGMEGAPMTYYASAHTPLNKTDITIPSLQNKDRRIKKMGLFQRARPHHGVGIMAQLDKTGPLKSTALNASYAYHLPFTNKLKLSAGISGGLLKYSLNTNDVHLAPTQYDPTLYKNNINQLKFDLNVGLWLYSQQFYLGAAASQLLRNTQDFRSAGNLYNPGSLQKHFIFTGGYKLDVTRSVSVIPSVQMYLALPSPPSVDVNLKAMYDNRVWAGVSYRHGDALAALAGVNISPLMDLNYSYDATSSELGRSSAGSHELVIGFKLRNRGKVICPIWMW